MKTLSLTIAIIALTISGIAQENNQNVFCSEAAAVINWVADTHDNSKAYVIERSLDKENWSQVAEVMGAGNNDLKLEYQFADDNVMSETTYFYRLTKNNMNGAEKTFKMMEVQCQLKNAGLRIVDVFTENGNIIVDYTVSTDETVKIGFSNTYGQDIFSTSTAPENGHNRLSIPAHTSGHDEYTLSISQNNTTETKTITL